MLKGGDFGGERFLRLGIEADGLKAQTRAADSA